MAIQDGLTPPSDYKIVSTIALRNIVSPKKDGLLVYVQDLGRFFKYSGGAWYGINFVETNILDVPHGDSRQVFVRPSADFMGAQITVAAYSSAGVRVKNYGVIFDGIDFFINSYGSSGSGINFLFDITESGGFVSVVISNPTIYDIKISSTMLAQYTEV